MTDEVLRHGEEPPVYDAKSYNPKMSRGCGLGLALSVVFIAISIGGIIAVNAFLQKAHAPSRLMYFYSNVVDENRAISIAYETSSSQYQLLLFDPKNGKIKWRSPIGDEYNIVQLQWGSDGLYTCDNQGIIRLYNARDGSLEWEKDVGAVTYRPDHMVAHSRGLLFLGNDDVLRSINNKGRTLWERDMQSWRDFYLLKNTVVIDDSGNAITGIQAKTGQTLWSIPVEARSICSDSRSVFVLYSGSHWQDINLVKINPAGKSLWQTTFPYKSFFSGTDSMVCFDRYIYIISDDTVWALNKSNGRVAGEPYIKGWEPLKIEETKGVLLILFEKSKGVTKLRLQAFDAQDFSPKWSVSVPEENAMMEVAGGEVCVARETEDNSLEIKSFDLKNGKTLWRKELADHDLTDMFTVRGSVVVVGMYFYTAFDAKTGEELWNGLR